jgi:hypothetical protein
MRLSLLVVKPDLLVGERNDVEFTHGICSDCREASLMELHSVPAGPGLPHKRREQGTAASARGSFVQ